MNTIVLNVCDRNYTTLKRRFYSTSYLLSNDINTMDSSEFLLDISDDDAELLFGDSDVLAEGNWVIAEYPESPFSVMHGAVYMGFVREFDKSTKKLITDHYYKLFDITIPVQVSFEDTYSYKQRMLREWIQIGLRTVQRKADNATIYADTWYSTNPDGTEHISTMQSKVPSEYAEEYSDDPYYMDYGDVSTDNLQDMIIFGTQNYHCIAYMGAFSGAWNASNNRDDNGGLIDTVYIPEPGTTLAADATTNYKLWCKYGPYSAMQYEEVVTPSTKWFVGYYIEGDNYGGYIEDTYGRTNLYISEYFDFVYTINKSGSENKVNAVYYYLGYDNSSTPTVARCYLTTDDEITVIDTSNPKTANLKVPSNVRRPLKIQHEIVNPYEGDEIDYGDLASDVLTNLDDGDLEIVVEMFENNIIREENLRVGMYATIYYKDTLYEEMLLTGIEIDTSKEYFTLTFGSHRDTFYDVVKTVKKKY